MRGSALRWAAGLTAVCLHASLGGTAAAWAQSDPLGGWDQPGQESGTPPADGTPTGPRAPRDLSQESRRRALRRAEQRVEAADYGQKLTIAVFGGGRVLPASLEVGSLAGNASPPRAASAGTLGLRLGYTPAHALALQAEGGWQPSRFAGEAERAHFAYIRGSASIFLTRTVVRPYLQVFGGMEWLINQVGAIGCDIDAALGGAAGAQWEVRDGMGVFAEYRASASDGRGGFAVIHELALGIVLRFQSNL